MTNQDKLKLARRATRHLRVASACRLRTLTTRDTNSKAQLNIRADEHERKANKLVAKIGGYPATQFALYEAIQ